MPRTDLEYTGTFADIVVVRTNSSENWADEFIGQEFYHAELVWTQIVTGPRKGERVQHWFVIHRLSDTYTREMFFDLDEVEILDIPAEELPHELQG